MNKGTVVRIKRTGKRGTTTGKLSSLPLTNGQVYSYVEVRWAGGGVTFIERDKLVLDEVGTVKQILKNYE